MLVFAVCNHKGGTGKTTTVLHMAAALGFSGRQTLVIDLDPQAFLTRTLGVGEPAEADTVLALFQHDLAPGDLTIRSMSGFDLLPSSNRLTKRLRSLNKPTDVLWVKEALERDVLGRSYDVVLFDTAAAVTVYSLNALVASQHVLIPVLPEYQGVIGAEQTYQTVQLVRSRLNPGLGPAHFLFTQVDARKGIHYSYRQYMREKYGEQALDTVIRTSTALAESHEDGTTLFDHDPQSRGARDYANATDELLHRFQPPGDSVFQADGARETEPPVQRVDVAATPPPEVLNS